MTAHAIDDGEKRRAVSVRYGDSILVFFTIPEQAQIRVLEVQGRLRHARYSGKLPRAL
jgi:hypothetical protein